jgi:hypothetical protein
MNNDTEITLYDIVNFLIKHVKLYLAVAILFIIGALAHLAIQPEFAASSTIHFASSNQDVSTPPFDLIAWRSLQQKLISLAQSSVEKHASTNPLLARLTETGWWLKHVSPVRSLTLDESKELLGINSMIVGINKPTAQTDNLNFLGRAIKEATQISGIVISNTAKTADGALTETSLAAKFIYEGYGVLAYQQLITRLSEQLRQSETQVAIELDKARQHLLALRQRHEGVAQLVKDYQGEKNVSPIQVSADANLKYLPLTNQLIGIDVDINESKSAILAFEQQQEQNKVLSIFISQANEILNKTSSFEVIGQQLIALISLMRQTTTPDNFAASIVLNTANKDVFETQFRLQTQLSVDTAVLTKQPNYWKAASKAAVLGLAAGFIFSILLLLVRVSLSKLRTTPQWTTLV